MAVLERHMPHARVPYALAAIFALLLPQPAAAQQAIALDAVGEPAHIRRQVDFSPPTPNSITVTAAGTRADPEGVAAVANVNRITWKDSRGADRAMVMGGYLYQYEYSFSDNLATYARTATDQAYGHPGFGYVVSHNTQNGNSPLGKANVPTSVETRVFAGGHHAIHRVELNYARDKEGGGLGIVYPVVIEWLVATGHDHPLWSVTWRGSQVVNPANTNFANYRMDTRGPYGSLSFDGAASLNAGDVIGGVAWGDPGYRFKTSSSSLTMMSPWTYNLANNVSFTQAWTQNINAEMGIVDTKVLDKEAGYQDRVVGRERGHASTDAFSGKGDCSDNRGTYVMPCINGWPYQMMNYDWSDSKPLTEPTSTKLMAWGAPYGWLGAPSFDLFDYSATADGRGDRGYATLIVLGPKQRYDAASATFSLDGDVAGAIAEVKALNAATITAVGPGSLATQAPKGPGASNNKALSNGYDDIRAAHELMAAGSQVGFTFTPAALQPVHAPIFVIRGYASSELPIVRIAGVPVSVNTGAATDGAFVSLDQASKELWVTINRTIGAATTIAIEPSTPTDCAGFVDVASGSNFCGNVSWLKSRKITVGCTDAAHYCPDAAVSRTSMAAFMNRVGVSLTALDAPIATQSGVAVSLTNTAYVLLCPIPEQPAAEYQRSATLRARTGLSGALQAFTGRVDLLASIDRGATWTLVGGGERASLYAPAANHGATRTLVSYATATIDAYTSPRFAVALRRTDSASAATATVACALDVQISSGN